MDLKFRRKLGKSEKNKASVIAIPRAVAQSWEQFSMVDLIFDGDCLVIKPIEISQLHDDDAA